MQKINSKLNRKYVLFGLGGVAIVVVGIVAAVLGFGRLSQEDCTTYEKYDALTGSCYFECDTDKQCEKIASKVDAELNAYFADSTAKIGTNKPTSPKTALPNTEQSNNGDNYKTFSAKETGSETGGKIYTVTKSQQLFPEPRGSDRQLWDLFTRVASKQIISERIETFEVFNDENNDSAASVWESSTPGKWHMNVNAAFASDKKDLIHTMVHEFGHVLTLNSTQVSKTSGACPLIKVPEGCIQQGTVLGDFYSAFWKQYGEEAGGETDDPVAEYSDKDFVSEYAATNMIEDVAETFAHFVLRPAPTGTSVKDQKIKQFYSHSDMVTTRNRIRAALADQL